MDEIEKKIQNEMLNT